MATAMDAPDTAARTPFPQASAATDKPSETKANNTKTYEMYVIIAGPGLFVSDMTSPFLPNTLRVAYRYGQCSVDS